MLNDTVSIIVPIYNKEKYLEKCLDSILGQTYRDLEIILVDDGSTDNSLSSCQRYAEKDLRIKIYHKPNGGVSSARNLGLEKSTGTLISFADPDDSLHAECIERLKRVRRLLIATVWIFWARPGERRRKAMRRRKSVLCRSDDMTGTAGRHIQCAGVRFTAVRSHKMLCSILT